MMILFKVCSRRMCAHSYVFISSSISNTLTDSLLHHHRLSTCCKYRHLLKIDTRCSGNMKASGDETLKLNLTYQRLKCMHHLASSDCDKNFSKTSIRGRRPMSQQLDQSNAKPEGRRAWRILYFGTDEFSMTSLKALNENRMNSSKQDPVVKSLDVVSNVGQTLVRQYAHEQDLKVHDWPVPVLKNMYDVGVCVSFGHLIPRKIIEMFPFGILNVHPSLLPRWRGANPIVHTILHGDKETGVSIMNIRPIHFDAGPLLMQVRCPTPEPSTTRQLSKFLAAKGANLLLQTLHDLPDLKPMQQSEDPTDVTHARKVKREMSFVDWTHQNVADIDRQYRALHELLPLQTDWLGSPVKLLDMVDPRELRDLNILNSSTLRYVSNDCFPGTPVYHKDTKCLLIKCKDGWVGFHSLVFKKKMSALAFFNGYLSKGKNTGGVFSSKSNQHHTDSDKISVSHRS